MINQNDTIHVLDFETDATKLASLCFYLKNAVDNFDFENSEPALQNGFKVSLTLCLSEAHNLSELFLSAHTSTAALAAS